MMNPYPTFLWILKMAFKAKRLEDSCVIGIELSRVVTGCKAQVLLTALNITRVSNKPYSVK